MTHSEPMPCQSLLRTGMARSILSEVAERLNRLAYRGQATSIDLRSLPMTDADREELESLLGRGEINASLALLGRTEIWETAYAGVWWVRHLDGNERVSSEELAVTFAPDILMSHPADVQVAAHRLRQDVETAATGTVEQPEEAGDG